MDNSSTINNNKPRVVATFTTLPDRYDLVRKSITSISNQNWTLDAIYLTIPHRAKRLNKEYPPVPDDINKLCTIIRIEEDYGPITKIYGALVSETDPNTIIISCDDDVIYHPNLVSKLVEHSIENSSISICGTGALIGKGIIPFLSIISSLAPFRKWNGLTGPTVSKKGRAVDLIFGVAGVLYRRGFFPDNQNLYEELLRHTENEYVFLNDDVLISGYLSRKGIKRMVFYDIPDVNCQEDHRQDALSYDLMTMVKKLNKSVDYMKSEGFFTNMEPFSLDETPTGKSIFAIIIIIIIIVLSIFFYWFI